MKARGREKLMTIRSRGRACNLIYGAVVVFVAIGIVTTYSVEDIFGQASDFFSNTQTKDARAGTGAAVFGGGTVSASNPGFNPCSGGSATRSVDGKCGSVTTGSLLSSDNLGTIFQQAGPGAVTDNMFGKVTAVVGTSTTFTDCGATASNINTVALADVLNCGNVRITPGTQGQNIPTFPTLNSLKNAALSGNANQLSDFCETGGTDCPDTNGGGGTQISDAHTGLNLLNEFIWNPTTGTETAPFTCSPGTSADVPNFCAQQIMEQVTALSTPVGTLGAPGTGDQQVRVEVTFSTLTSNSLGSMPSAFMVSISGRIEDPNMSGSGSGFKQTLGAPGAVNTQTFGTAGMTFQHNAAGPGGGTQLFSCVGGTDDVGCSSYPTGPGQTSGTQPSNLP